MSAFKNLLKALPLGLALPLAIGAASVKPEDAASNLSGWAEWLGFRHIPTWLADPSIDRKVVYGTIGLSFVYALAVWGLPRLSIARRNESFRSPRFDHAERDQSPTNKAIREGLYEKQRAFRERPLQIIIGDEFSDVPDETLYQITKRIRLAIRNTDNRRSVLNCKVQITAIEPDSGYRHFPYILDEGFSLNSGDQRFVPLASYKERRERGAVSAETALAVHASERDLYLPLDNVLTIRATAADCPYFEVRCRIWVDDSGRLRIAAATWPRCSPVERPTFVDKQSHELGGVVHALMERAGSYNFKLPLAGDDPHLKQLSDLKDSPHPIWTDGQINQLRRDFLQRCYIIGARDEVGYSVTELQEYRNQLRMYGNELIERLTGIRRPFLQAKRQ